MFINLYVNYRYYIICSNGKHAVTAGCSLKRAHKSARQLPISLRDLAHNSAPICVDSAHNSARLRPQDCGAAIYRVETRKESSSLIAHKSAISRSLIWGPPTSLR